MPHSILPRRRSEREAVLLTARSGAPRGDRRSRARRAGHRRRHVVRPAPTVPFHGYSAEFSQYRHYRPGDDLKYIDWKLFARTDRLYTKQYRETTNLVAQIVVDASASMAYAGPRPASRSCDYARLLAAALAHLIRRPGDAVGLAVYDERAPAATSEPIGQAHLRGVLAALTKMQRRAAATRRRRRCQTRDRSAEPPRPADAHLRSLRRERGGRSGAAARRRASATRSRSFTC